MFFQRRLGKKRMKHGPKDWHFKIYVWVGISGDFVLEVRVKALLYLGAGVLLKLELYLFQGFLCRWTKPAWGGNSDVI